MIGGSLLGVFYFFLVFLLSAFSVVVYIGDRGVCFVFLSFIGVMGIVTGCFLLLGGSNSLFILHEEIHVNTCKLHAI